MSGRAHQTESAMSPHGLSRGFDGRARRAGGVRINIWMRGRVHVKILRRDLDPLDVLVRVRKQERNFRRWRRLAPLPGRMALSQERRREGNALRPLRMPRTGIFPTTRVVKDYQSDPTMRDQSSRFKSLGGIAPRGMTASYLRKRLSIALVSITVNRLRPENTAIPHQTYAKIQPAFRVFLLSNFTRRLRRDSLTRIYLGVFFSRCESGVAISEPKSRYQSNRDREPAAHREHAAVSTAAVR
jgi:hypothetical protein